ncbi:hypothetical protein B2M20_15975 [Nitrobacter vulgaris]|uniref:Uncharacterized protein n=1 Tax=Nitrobacter vulgaris TaxID=29421 RepID=A0A1V4HVN4_NITVU|nr:hypothetical protein B2M20_15975 [Nitrobacter vulgaris]
MFNIQSRLFAREEIETRAETILDVTDLDVTEMKANPCKPATCSRRTSRPREIDDIISKGIIGSRRFAGI